MQFNKIVRDKIPEIIKSNGDIPITRVLSNEEFLRELDKKLDKEVKEYQESKEIEELADILEVIYAISESKGYSREEFFDIYQRKHNERGGFSKKIFLISKK